MQILKIRRAYARLKHRQGSQPEPLNRHAAGDWGEPNGEALHAEQAAGGSIRKDLKPASCGKKHHTTVLKLTSWGSPALATLPLSA